MTIPRRLPIAIHAAAFLAALTATATAAESSPHILARFTRQVQPLVLNRCAAGACHGSPRGHAPLFRGDPANSDDTRANAATFLGLVGPDGDPATVFQRLADGHPSGTKSRTLVMAPLTPRERAVLETWLVDARRAGDRGTISDPAVMPAGFAEPATAPRPNRFRTLLETGVPPPPTRDPPRDGRRAFSGLVDRRTAPPADAAPPAAER